MVASNNRGPGFESSHWQLLLNNYSPLTVSTKDENNEKEEGYGPLKKVCKEYFCKPLKNMEINCFAKRNLSSRVYQWPIL